MAIDAVIRRVREALPGEGTADDYVLELGPRNHNSAGQPKLVLLNPVRLPPAGAAIWGGDSWVEIVVPSGKWGYRREGYTRIREGR